MLVWYHVDYNVQLSHYSVPGQASSKGLTCTQCTHTFIITVTENCHTFVGLEGNFLAYFRKLVKTQMKCDRKWHFIRVCSIC